MPLCEKCEEPTEILSVVRGHNSTLRRINKILRSRLQTNKSIQDVFFYELCNSSPAASIALREIWEKAGLDCSPDDYPEIVEKVVSAYLQIAGTKPGVHTNLNAADTEFIDESY
jgi:8-oxo-dGTP pyrophosphatase MutT (NUDIX family)